MTLGEFQLGQSLYYTMENTQGTIHRLCYEDGKGNLILLGELSTVSGGLSQEEMRQIMSPYFKRAEDAKKRFEEFLASYTARTL